MRTSIVTTRKTREGTLLKVRNPFHETETEEDDPFAVEEEFNYMLAVIESGTLRFRAIILTSITTAAGLLPILLEKSVQAQFVIPMAISVGFGILFATVITLFLIPTLYMLQLDFNARARYLWDLLLGRPESSQRA